MCASCFFVNHFLVLLFFCLLCVLRSLILPPLAQSQNRQVAATPLTVTVCFGVKIYYLHSKERDSLIFNRQVIKKTENTEYFCKKVPRYQCFGIIFEKVPPVPVLQKYRGILSLYDITAKRRSYSDSFFKHGFVSQCRL